MVPPQEATIDGDPALHENIRVPGSHLGLGFNALVLWIVADRLAQPEEQWRPFEPAGLLGADLPPDDLRDRARAGRSLARARRRSGRAARWRASARYS